MSVSSLHSVLFLAFLAAAVVWSDEFSQTMTKPHARSGGRPDLDVHYQSCNPIAWAPHPPQVSPESPQHQSWCGMCLRRIFEDESTKSRGQGPLQTSYRLALSSSANPDLRGKGGPGLESVVVGVGSYQAINGHTRTPQHPLPIRDTTRPFWSICFLPRQLVVCT